MQKCDIVIPIYNAYDCIKECLDSVLRHTNKKNIKIILINDKSPDERISPLLQEFYKKHKNRIILLENKKNLGFVGTVNKGMRYSKNDVLLLNSDTVVSKNWLDKMQACAYRGKMIATVTPLSNNMTPLRLPDIIREKGVPDGYTYDEIAQFIEDKSLHLYPEIPSSHGFCMYIKREALEKVGFFDEKTFGKGYGEENDFCFRCLKYGYRHILCDDTYILHKGSQSFLNKKVFHDDELRTKHPVIRSRVDQWYEKQDLSKISNNIALAIATEDIRPNILVLARDFNTPYLSNMPKLSKEFNLHVLANNKGSYEIRSFFEKVDITTAVYEKSLTVEDVNFYSEEYATMLKSVINDFKISIVYIDSLIGHSFNIPYICKEQGITCLFNKKGPALPPSAMLDKKSWKAEFKKFLTNVDGVNKKSGYDKMKKYSKKQKLNYETLKNKLLEYHFALNLTSATIIDAKIASEKFSRH